MNKFEIIEKYKSCNTKDFLYWLLQIKEIIHNSDIVRYISSILKDYNRYEKYSFISNVKGALSFNKKEKSVNTDYYSYEKSEVLKNQIDVLWKRLNIDDRYFSEPIMHNYKIIKDCFGKKKLSSVSLNKEGYFVIGKGKEAIEVNVFTTEEYKKIKDFITIEKVKDYISKDEVFKNVKAEKDLSSLNIDDCLISNTEDGYVVLDVTNPILKKCIEKTTLDEINHSKEDIFHNNKSKNIESIKIDGKEMLLLPENKGFKFAISKSEPYEAFLIEYNGNDKEVTIPNYLTVNGKRFSVVEIKDNAFEHCESSQIHLPDNLKEIRNYAFADCKNLTDIFLPNGLKSIGVGAFNNSGIIKINIPENVLLIDNNTFIGCQKLKEFTVSEGNHFYSVNNGCLIKNESILVCYPIGKNESVYTIPEEITVVGDSAFKGSALKEIKFNESLVLIENDAFKDNYNLEKVITNKNLSIIKDRAFENDNKLQLIDLSNVTEIGSKSFLNTRLEEIKFNKVENIKEDAFKNNIKLKEVMLNSKNAIIKLSAFNNCPIKNEITGTFKFTDQLQMAKQHKTEKIKRDFLELSDYR